jgi:hypothetical protein
MEMNNLIYSVYDDNEQLSDLARDIFRIDPDFPEHHWLDGVYNFQNYYGLVGKVRFNSNRLDLEHLDKQIPKRFRSQNDHIFLEGMTINEYGLITLWLGS